jgi:O-antigen/teichoic acid export membrane protein
MAGLGLHLLVGREIAVPGADRARLHGQAMGLRLTSKLILLLLAAALAWFLPYDRQVWTGILLGIPAFVLFAGRQLLDGLFQQKLRQAGPVLAEIGGALVLLALTLLLAALGGNVLSFIGVVVLGHLVAMAIAWRFAQNLLPFRVGFDAGCWRWLTRASLPLAGANVLTIVYYHSDTILLSLLSPAREVGLYGVASKVQDTLIGIATIFAGLMLPLLTRVAPQPRWFRQQLGQGLDAVAVGAIGCAAVLVAFARPLVVLIGGPAFAASAVVLQLLGLAVGIGAISVLLRYSITALGRQSELLPAYLLAGVASLVAQLLLVPDLGASGAAVGPLVGELLMLLAAWRVLASQPGLAPSATSPLKALLAGVGLVLLAWYTPFVHLPWPVSLLLLGSAYLAVMILSGGLRRSMLELVAAGARG